ncbi:MAG: MT-A70 family methyltransferase [Candidatus Nanoarchaeia archaeon]
MKQIEKLKTWKKELALAETFEEVKTHESAAAAAAEFAKRNKIALDKQNEIGKFRIDIERKKGAWLDENYPQGGKNKYTKMKVEQPDLHQMPVTKDESSKARLINREEELSNQVMDEIELKGEVITPNKVQSEIRKIIKKEKRINEIKEQIKEIENGNIPELKGLYDVISIDPAWNYEGENKNTTSYDANGRRVANPYPEMTIQEIKNINLPLMEDAVVFLWTTHKFLPDAFDILRSWELDYKATLVWNKEKIGMGAWFRMQCEFCLVGIKGKPYWNNTIYRDIMNEPRRQHSRKPDVFFDMVDKITLGRKLEYFSREKREGWEVFGNDINKF